MQEARLIKSTFFLVFPVNPIDKNTTIKTIKGKAYFL